MLFGRFRLPQEGCDVSHLQQLNCNRIQQRPVTAHETHAREMRFSRKNDFNATSGERLDEKVIDVIKRQGWEFPH